MMASPAASTGDLAVPMAQDPWDWTVEDVVSALTSPAGLLRQMNPQYSSDSSSLIHLIQDQELWGSMLLRLVNVAYLEQKMGFISDGSRWAVLDAVEELQKQSPKYQNYQMKRASSAAPSIYGPFSYVGENQPIQPNNSIYPMMPPLRRYLAEPLQSPDPRAVQVSQPGSTFSDNTNGHTDRWRQSQFLENTGYDQSNNESLQPEEAQATPRITFRHQDVSDSNLGGTQLRAYQQGQEQNVPEHMYRKSSLQDGVDSNLHSGELYVVEHTGNKRRKLDLSEHSEVIDKTEGVRRESEDTIVGRMHGGMSSYNETVASPLNVSNMHDIDEVSKAPDDFTAIEEETSVVQKDSLSPPKATTDHELPSHPGSKTPSPSVHEDISAVPDLILEDPIAAMSDSALEVKEPGKVEIDAQGRKRMIPILITQPVEEQEQEDRSVLPIKSTHRKDEIIKASNSGSEECLENIAASKSNSKSAKRRSSDVYLGVNALPVDKVFYGDTAMNEVVSYDVLQDTIFPLESDGAVQNHSSWFLSSKHSLGSGAQLYISNRLKYFLMRPDPILLNHRSEVTYCIIPYPARVVQSVKRHQPLSMTLMSKSNSEFITKRVNRPGWVVETGEAQIKNRVPSINHVAADSLDVLGNDSLLSRLGENEIHDWDFLEKWRHTANGDDVLPLYGDSDSDCELDLDTWQEIEREEAKEGRKLERHVGLSKHKHLSTSEVSDAIQHAIDLLVNEWETKKLPFLGGKAWRLWTKSRRDKNKKAQIKQCISEIARLEHYLRRIRDEIMLERWSKVEIVMKQCQSAHLTVFDRELEKWKIGILKLRSPPRKPEQAEKQGTVRRPKITPESLEEDEEDLETDNSIFESSDDGLDEFIVDEGEESNDDRLMQDALHETQSSEEDVDILISDPSPLVVNKERDDASTSSELLDEGQDLSSPVNTSSPDSVSLDDKVRNTPNDDDSKLLSSSPVLLGAVPNETRFHEPLTRHGSVYDLFSSHDYIDLTQLSDGPEPLAPQIKEEKYRIHTPPLDDRNPFRRVRRAPPVFKSPPTPSNIINMESDDSPIIDSTAVEDELLPIPKEKKSLPSSPSKQPLPGLQDIEGIASLDCALLVERQDRKRLLTWIIAHTPAATRTETLAATSISSSIDIQWDIWIALRAIKGHATKLRHTDVSSEAFMQIAAWYVSWHMCRVYSERNGIPQSHVKETIGSEAGFEEYYNFIVERLDTIKLNADKRKEAKRKGEAKIGLMSSGSKSSSKKRQKRIDDESELPNHTSHKKRKYIVPESQTALQMRDYNQQRFQERLRRQAQLQSQFSKMGASSENPITMIVNGKANEEMIVINKEIGTRIQPHQLEGIQFMWSEIVTNDQEQGCLLAHSMGLGKTMQVITLLVTIAEASQHTNEVVSNQVPTSLRKTRALILCPPSLVDNWYDELLMWMPGAASTILGDIHKISAAISPPQRLTDIQEWADNGGVLLVGYNMFKNLVQNKPRGKIDNKKQSLTNEEHEKARSQLLEFPTVIVADEAHTIKTRNSDISKAVRGFISHRRIALTGSPLANNLMEYYTIIDWIAPGYLGSRAEFSYKYVEPIGDGLFADATQYQKRKGLKMLQVLKAELAPKVHRADVGILKGRLKGKTEFVLRVPLTQLQHDSYKLYVDHMLTAIKSKEPGSARLWAWLAILRLLCNHPQCFKNKLLEKPKERKANKKVPKPPPKVKEPESQTEIAVALEEDIDELLEDSVENVGLPKAMISEQLARLAQETIPIGSVGFAHKMQLLLQILKLSIAVNDKVLVFSHSLDTLDYVGELLKNNSYAYERLDGKTNMSSRQQLTKDFNNMESASVCLISTRAGGQGLNLFGANRVVIMDDTFNPMYEEQAIGRAYRIGQLKHVYVYRLTVGGTFEQALQDQSLFKLQLATRVVDKKNPMRHALKGAREYLFQPRTVDQKDLSEFVGKDVDVLDKILASQDDTCIIRSIDLSETFQQEVDEPLTAEEQKEAEEMVEDEKLRRTNPEAYELVKHQRQQKVAQEQAQLLGRNTEPHPVQNPPLAYAAGVRFKQPLLGHDVEANPESRLSSLINNRSRPQDHVSLTSELLVLNAHGPPSSTSMTNSEWEQFQRTHGLGLASTLTSLSNTVFPRSRTEQDRSTLSRGLDNRGIPPAELTDDTRAGIATSDVVTSAIVDQSDRLDPTATLSTDIAAPESLRTTPIRQERRNADEIGQLVANMDPVHGLNIRVQHRSLSRSPDAFSVPGLPQRTFKNPKLLKLGDGRPRTPSIGNRPVSSEDPDHVSPSDSPAAASTRANAGLVNSELLEMTSENREEFRSALVPRIAALIGEEMRIGRLAPIPELDVMVIAKLLAESIERHAYKNATDQDDYRKNAEKTFHQLNKTDDGLSILVAGARGKLNARLSRSRSATQTRQMPSTPKTPRHDETILPETIEADHPDADGAGDKGESVGVSVPSPLSKPPDLSIFQSLRHMMQRGANRKTG